MQQAESLSLVPEQVLICCGGGGLSAGCALAIRDASADTAVWLVEPEDFDDTRRSFAAGHRVGNRPEARSICDALQTEQPGEMTFAINRELCAGVLTVSDREVGEAMRFAFRHLKLVVEPGGAVGLAAVLAGRLETRGRVTALVLSGGNVDERLFAQIQQQERAP